MKNLFVMFFIVFLAACTNQKQNIKSISHNNIVPIKYDDTRLFAYGYTPSDIIGVLNKNTEKEDQISLYSTCPGGEGWYLHKMIYYNGSGINDGAYSVIINNCYGGNQYGEAFVTVLWGKATKHQNISGVEYAEHLSPGLWIVTLNLLDDNDPRYCPSIETKVYVSNSKENVTEVQNSTKKINLDGCN